MEEYPEITEFFLNVSTNIFAEVDSGGRVIYANNKAEYAFRLQSAATLDKAFDEDTAAVLKKHLHNTFFQHYPETFSFEFQGRFYNAFIYPRQNNAALCIEDITERRQLSHRLHQTKQRLEFAERTAKLGYWELDILAKHFYWSAEMYRIFGIDNPHISNKKNLIREQVFEEDFPIYKEKIAELLKQRHPVEGQVRVHRRDNTIAYCLFKAGLIYDKTGERIAGTFQDITSMIEIQQALEQAKAEADRLNMAKSYFLAQASHDLRQPMQALNMFIAALDEQELTKSQHAIVKKIEASAANLKSLLDNLLDISKLDSGGMDYQPEEFDLQIFLQRLCREYKELSLLKGIRLKCRFRQVYIKTDPLLVERIVRNFLSNAFKYARDKIVICCSDGPGGIKISVLDNGVGIAPEDMELIFEDFYQSPAVPENRKNGAGLGLSIVKKISGLLGAAVDVRSRPGRYTVFTLKFPPSAAR